MIAKIRGTILFLRNGYLVVDVNGIGYKVFVTAYALGKLAGKGEANLFIHTHVREDVLALYGFLSLAELEMFELLLGVSGVGPKAALGILSIADPETICTAIASRDASILTKVSGVGRKIAERVILDLQNKVANITDAEKLRATGDSDAIEALASMGYSVAEARESLKLVPADVKDVGERVRKALQNLGKK